MPGLSVSASPQADNTPCLSFGVIARLINRRKTAEEPSRNVAIFFRKKKEEAHATYPQSNNGASPGRDIFPAARLNIATFGGRYFVRLRDIGPLKCAVSDPAAQRINLHNINTY
ncbi:hypothetical protein EVAR_62950_1 [Eumeta japonica]|uniref:Uncharacterized protein n=1 Tax=Eumeta variegata TaxID=151549 RepID=A0A4C1T0T8_EUMVA|nr:hypothetical protein EVAR_62950_1 [Eumeta japonica]